MIYVDSYDHQIPSGRFQIASTMEIHPFHGLTQLVLKINDILDCENFPQSFTALRKFQDPHNRPQSSPASGYSEKGAAATFSLRILFRQNASWQGTLAWAEGKQEECFRSVLELIVLLDNALGYSENT
ncbi:MAG: hypothetical protein IJC71_07075 [Clostridia bacterium]|nr:hypothetical protein [Clostridia bacterium]